MLFQSHPFFPKFLSKEKGKVGLQAIKAMIMQDKIYLQKVVGRSDPPD